MDRAFAIGVALNLGFVAVEAGFGFSTGSMALLGDAGHNLGDVLGLVLAWGASALARRRPTARHTYGFRKATVLAALSSSVLLLVAMGGFAVEAGRRVLHPEPVAGSVMLVVAAIGVLINAGTALLFTGHHGDLNVRGAYLHMAADAAVSGGVVVAGGLVITTGWTWVDPAVGLVIVVVILISTLDLFRDSLGLAMDAVPRGIDADQVQRYLRDLPEVVEVHDLHIWAMSTREVALTAHVVVPRGSALADDFLHRLARDLHDRFGIEHTTVQVEHEPAPHACELAPSDRV